MENCDGPERSILSVYFAAAGRISSDPQGVGGTHVMYVLHHANQPELYHGLPKDPQIDTSINLWKGALKPLAAAGFIATFAGLIYHYIGIGPNKETDDDEEDHHE